MKNRIFTILLALALLLAACSPKPTANPDVELYLNIIWHQHQPFYATDPETGLVTAPWVRLHAAKDYVDMVAMLQYYPGIHATFNLTPSLIRQIDDLVAGKRDIVWELTMVPADQLTDTQKTYILQRFFDTNGAIIARFPRYQELQLQRVGASEEQIAAAVANWDSQDFLDLQVLFNLAWTDPDYLAEAPLAGLVAKGSGFSEADKVTVLDVHLDLLEQVIPVHRQMQEDGQIEITFTPYAHPILPLLVDSNLAQQAVPDISLPTRFTHGDDAIVHLERGMALYEDHFGQEARGMWPAEGSVAQMMVGMTARAGVEWMVTDEGILANSLGLNFTRLAEGVPMNANSLYRPYSAGRNDETVTIFFRDTTLSNKVSFDYSQIPAGQAVADFIGRLRAIRDSVKDLEGGPYVATVILDGENAWEWYENDGKEFLNGIYTELSNDPTIQTVTPSEFLALYGQQPESIPDLWAGSWDNATFETWIGETEENRAWEYLSVTRNFYGEYLNGSMQGQVSAEAMEAATLAMLAAEGSDWFWWYGADKDSGNDAAFDEGFRETLGQVYDALGLERPEFLGVPIIQPAAVEPDVDLAGLMEGVVDGAFSATDEWDNAGGFALDDPADLMQFGFNKNLLFLRFDNPPATPPGYSIYLKAPAISDGSPFTDAGQVLGMFATHRVQVTSDGASFETWDDGKQAWEAAGESAFVFAAGRESAEMSIPLAELYPTLDAGDSLLIRLDSADGLYPAAGPGRMLLPDLGRTTYVIDVSDPADDDHGPGPYVYPTDGVFVPGVFDLLNFKVGYDENNLVFRMEMRGPVDNPWNAPNSLSIQAVDIYIDVDGPAAGNRLLRSARNASLTAESGWDFAMTVAGWNYGFFTAASPDKAASDVPLTIFTDPG
ncbi:MAG: glycoside hydrolase [Chloroflexi bacterium]|nr:glycoside hydrolase [Chloroflexota bacterium]